MKRHCWLQGDRCPLRWAEDQLEAGAGPRRERVSPEAGEGRPDCEGHLTPRLANSWEGPGLQAEHRPRGRCHPSPKRGDVVGSNPQAGEGGVYLQAGRGQPSLGTHALWCPRSVLPPRPQRKERLPDFQAESNWGVTAFRAQSHVSLHAGLKFTFQKGKK